MTDHRKHHALSDREGDPALAARARRRCSAGLSGFFHAHMGWLVTTKGMERGRRYGRDLLDDPLIRLIDRLYMLWVRPRPWGSRSRSATRSTAARGRAA